MVCGSSALERASLAQLSTTCRVALPQPCSRTCRSLLSTHSEHLSTLLTIQSGCSELKSASPCKASLHAPRPCSPPSDIAAPRCGTSLTDVALGCMRPEDSLWSWQLELRSSSWSAGQTAGSNIPPLKLVRTLALVPRSSSLPRRGFRTDSSRPRTSTNLQFLPSFPHTRILGS